MRILIVRTSSLGDIVFALPVVKDILAHMPNAQIDWVCEEAFVEIPSWNSGVQNVIPMAHRRWRKRWFSRQTRQERKAFREALQSQEYDVILDLQSLFKSLWVSRQAIGPICGFDWKSAIDKPATWWYDSRFRVNARQQVDRYRGLAARVLGYAVKTPADYGLDKLQIASSAKIDTPPYAVLVTSASTVAKRWNESAWQAVIEALQARGLQVKMTSGNPQEQAYAESIAAGRSGVVVLPKSSLTQTAQILAGATVVLGVDTGLVHISAALEVPTITIYCDSDPDYFYVKGRGFLSRLGSKGQAPELAQVLASLNDALSYRANAY